MKKAIILIVILFVSCGVFKSNRFEPTYNSEDIQRMAEWKFGYDLKNIDMCDFYVINGVIYDSTTINIELAKYNKSEIPRISFAKQSQDNIYFDNSCELITIISTNVQSEKEKKELLIEIRNFYNRVVPTVRIRDWICHECKALTLNNGLPILPYDAKDILNKLKIEQIKYITVYEQPVNVEFFASGSDNGLIEIFLN